LKWLRGWGGVGRGGLITKLHTKMVDFVVRIIADFAAVGTTNILRA